LLKVALNTINPITLGLTNCVINIIKSTNHVKKNKINLTLIYVYFASNFIVEHVKLTLFFTYLFFLLT
jgi:hypothetical protein